MIDANEFIEDKIHPNTKVSNFKWMYSKYDSDGEWLFYITKDKIYFEDLEDFNTLKEIKTKLISRDDADGSLEEFTCIRDIRDGPGEIFYKVRTLKDTLKKL